MTAALPTRNEVISNLVQSITYENEEIKDLTQSTLRRNFDTFFNNLEQIAENYMEIKNIPSNSKWVNTPMQEQVYLSYSGIEKIHLKDLSGCLERYYDSISDLRQKVNTKYNGAIINALFNHQAKKYVLDFEINEKYRRKNAYNLILGNGTSINKDDSEFDRNLNLI